MNASLHCCKRRPTSPRRTSSLAAPRSITATADRALDSLVSLADALAERAAQTDDAIYTLLAVRACHLATGTWRLCEALAEAEEADRRAA